MLALQLYETWASPKSIMAVLLIIGGDIVGKALAQIAGGPQFLNPLAFGSAGVAFQHLMAAFGDHRLLPAPDSKCLVINASSGYVRDSQSWTLGRLMRDFKIWKPVKTDEAVKLLIQEKTEEIRRNSPDAEEPRVAGLCVSVYKPSLKVKAGQQKGDKVNFWGHVVAAIQLAIGAAVAVKYHSFTILIITGLGIILGTATSMLPQWRKEKFTCGKTHDQGFIISKGNGSQHAVIVLPSGDVKNPGLNFEQLASAGMMDEATEPDTATKLAIGLLATLWCLLLIQASAEEKYTWFLLLIGGLGTLYNLWAASTPRDPSTAGIHFDFQNVIANKKVMEALFKVEEAHPGYGLAMLKTFFPGDLFPKEIEKWNLLKESKKSRKEEKKQEKLEAARRNVAGA